MGKRKRMAGGDGDRRDPQTKRGPREDLEVSRDDGSDGCVPTATAGGDREEAVGGSAGTRSGNGDREQNRAGERGSSRQTEEGRETDIGGGGKSPEAPVVVAASPHWLGLATREPEEEPVGATERDRSANNQSPCQMDVDGGSAEGAAGREIPADAPAALPAPCQEDGDAGEIRESASVVDAEEKERGAACEPTAGAEQQESGSGEQLQAAGVNGAVENAAESRHSCGSGFVEDLGMCGPAADPDRGVGAASGNASLQETARDGDAGWEEAGEIPSPASSVAPNPAVPNAAGLSPTVRGPAGEGEGLTARPDMQFPAHSGKEITECSPVLAMPDPADTAQPSATGAAPAAGAESQDEACCAGSSAELQPEQPRAGQSPAEATPQPCAEENGSEPPWPRSEVPAPLYPPDATDVVCGLILELSNLNRLAMSAHRGLEMLRRPKVRRSRRSGPALPGRRWKEM